MTQTLSPQAAINRIAALTGAARATWLTFLGIILFTGVTLISVKDADFFAAQRNVELPLIGVSVPVSLFFLFGAVLVAVVHVYLHVFLEELWSVLAAAPPQVDARPLATAVAPWLVTAFALHVRTRLRPGEPRAITATALGLIGGLASFLILYGAAPLVLAWLWLRSQPAHIAWLTLSIGLMTVAAAGISLLSLRALQRAMSPSRLAKRPWALPFGMAMAVLVTVLVSLARTVWDPMGAGVTRDPQESTVVRNIANWFRPAIADLRQFRLTRQTPDWLPREESVASFARDWCAGRNLHQCRETGLGNPEFRDAYRAYRHRWMAIQDKPDLSGRHMDHADLVLAFLPGVVLNQAQLRRADMQGAQMEGVRAIRADMTASVLLDAHWDFAEARYAKFSHANMNGFSAVGASLVGADFSEAGLSEAELQYGILNFAKFSRAGLVEARLNEALLHRAHFDGANLRDARLEGAKLVQTDFAGARLEATRLHGASVSSADFSGAFISWTLVETAGDFSFGRTDFSGTRLIGVAFRGIDARRAIFDGPEQLNWVFGDASVTLPEEMSPPCHWADEVLDDYTFHARWRGVVENMSIQRTWDTFAPDVHANVRPILPPEGCALTPFDYEEMVSRPPLPE